MGNLHNSLNEQSSLPDSLEDAARIASSSCLTYTNTLGISPARCRVDFDTTIGDETYTKLKSSTEFMQKFVTYTCCSYIPLVLEERQKCVQDIMSAKAELLRNDNELSEERREELSKIINNGGSNAEDKVWKGGKARIYFPDEGNAALAKRDWVKPSSSGVSLVPSCVEFSSITSLQVDDTSKDIIQFYFCPEASESGKLETILSKNEAENESTLKLSIFVNPNLVDMGVTGFGMAGRLLRERLIDPLVTTYYLRTLPWGALTRVYPFGFTVYQEDGDVDDGYRCVQVLDRLPSNPEVEDIYDAVNSG